MIVFDLRCDRGHVFEAWFGSSADFDAQRERKLVACPLCDSTAVDKAPMAPAVPAKSNQRPAQPMAAVPDEAAKAKALMNALVDLQRRVESDCDYVGDRFADEARAIHLGERDADRGIYGETSADEARALLDEGIAVAPLPFRPRQRSDA